MHGGEPLRAFALFRQIIMFPVQESQGSNPVPYKSPGDWQPLFHVFHWLTRIDRDNVPSLLFKFIAYSGPEIFIIDGTAVARYRGIVITDRRFFAVMPAVEAKVPDTFAQFAFIFHIERLECTHGIAVLPAGYSTVDAGIAVRGNACGPVAIRAGVLQATLIPDFVEPVFRAVRAAVIAGRAVMSRFAHAVAEAVLQYADPPARDGGLEDRGRKIPLHLPDAVFAGYRQVVHGRNLYSKRLWNVTAPDRIPFRIA
jgi:hypothetical protein